MLSPFLRMSNFIRRLSGEKGKKGVIRQRQSSSDGETPDAKRPLDNRNSKKLESRIRPKKSLAKSGITGVTILEKSVKQTVENMSIKGEMATTSETVITMSTLLTEIRGIKTTLDEFKLEQNSLRTFVENRLGSFETTMSTDMTKLRKSLETDVITMNNRFDTVEIRMGKLEGICEEQSVTKDFTPEKSIIIRNLKEEDRKTDEELVKEMLYAGMDIPTENIKVMRMNAYNNKPGLIKVQFDNKQEKIHALRNKMKLKNIPRYQNVYVRSSKDYNERMMEQNMNTLLREIPGARDKLRMTGSGKLVLKNPVEGTRPSYVPQVLNTEEVISTDHLYARHLPPTPHYSRNENAYSLNPSRQTSPHHFSHSNPTLTHNNGSQLETLVEISSGRHNFPKVQENTSVIHNEQFPISFASVVAAGPNTQV